MHIQLRYDRQKSIEFLLYVSARCSDMYTALKILYFADKDHLSNYGRLMCDEAYDALKHGPVPIGAYEILRMAKGESSFPPETEVTSALRVSEDNKIEPLRDCNDDLMSESERESLDRCIEQYGAMSFDELKRQSHDAAYEAASGDDRMPTCEIVNSLPDGELIWDYLIGE